MKSKFVYILRFVIQPGHHVEKRLRKLIKFCSQAKIDDVMFFVDCEELNTGHITIEETEPWIQMIASAKENLDELGITTSINPWATLLHADRGRNLKPGQNFTTMVDPYGQEASVQVCPLCENWRKYITKLYQHYAGIRPAMIWIEDDFRFHNHSPLSWGGCFCDRHMERFSEIAGEELRREDFVKGILRPGKPHPYRELWLQSSRHTMLELAGVLENAVHKISPEIQIGLMSSSPDSHCAEGRDWYGILENLDGNMPAAIRPHLPSYIEVTPQNYLWNFISKSRRTLESIPHSSEVYPELDNGPFSRFSKSISFTQFQIETTLCLGADGITISLFDMMGNGVLMEEAMQKMLSKSKGFMNECKGRELLFEYQRGVNVLFNPDSSYSLHTEKGESMYELYPHETFWACLLSSYGILNISSKNLGQRDSIVAISGQYFRNLTEMQIAEIFEYNNVLLDGEAAYTLFDMGIGNLARIKSVTWHEQSGGNQSYEEVCNGKKYCGINNARLSAQNICGCYAEIGYEGQVENISVVKNYYGKQIGNGMVIVNNSIFILPFGKFDDQVQSHLFPVRQQVIQEVISRFDNNEDLLYVKNTPHVYPCMYKNDSGNKILILSNFSNDNYNSVCLYAPSIDEKKIKLTSRNELNLQKIECVRENNEIIVDYPLSRLETVLFVLD